MDGDWMQLSNSQKVKCQCHVGQLWYGGICSLGEQFIKRLMATNCKDHNNNNHYAIEIKDEIFFNP